MTDAYSVVRVAPAVERNPLNRPDDETHVRLAFGAPPIGTSTISDRTS